MLENEAVFFRRLQSNSLVVVVRGQEEACQASESITSIFSVSSSSSSSIFCKHEDCQALQSATLCLLVHFSPYLHVHVCVSVCVAYQLLESPYFSDDVVSVC